MNVNRIQAAEVKLWDFSAYFWNTPPIPLSPNNFAGYFFSNIDYLHTGNQQLMQILSSLVGVNDQTLHGLPVERALTVLI